MARNIHQESGVYVAMMSPPQLQSESASDRPAKRLRHGGTTAPPSAQEQHTNPIFCAPNNTTPLQQQLSGDAIDTLHDANRRNGFDRVPVYIVTSVADGSVLILVKCKSRHELQSITQHAELRRYAQFVRTKKPHEGKAIGVTIVHMSDVAILQTEQYVQFARRFSRTAHVVAAYDVSATVFDSHPNSCTRSTTVEPMNKEATNAPIAIDWSLDADNRTTMTRCSKRTADDQHRRCVHMQAAVERYIRSETFPTLYPSIPTVPRSVVECTNDTAGAKHSSSGDSKGPPADSDQTPNDDLDAEEQSLNRPAVIVGNALMQFSFATSTQKSRILSTGLDCSVFKELYKKTMDDFCSKQDSDAPEPLGPGSNSFTVSSGKGGIAQHCTADRENVDATPQPWKDSVGGAVGLSPWDSANLEAAQRLRAELHGGATLPALGQNCPVLNHQGRFAAGCAPNGSQKPSLCRGKNAAHLGNFMAAQRGAHSVFAGPDATTHTEATLRDAGVRVSVLGTGYC